MFGSRGTKGNNTLDKRKKLRQKIRLSMTLFGETAKILAELRARGVIRSYSDGVCQGIRLLYEKILEQDLRSARLKVLETSPQKDEFVDS